MARNAKEPVSEAHDEVGARRLALRRLLRPVRTQFPLIRIGDFGDGGYLVPDDLAGIVACFSPGVSRQASFELDLAKRGIPSFMADASVDGPPADVPGARFVKRFLGPETQGEFLQLDDWVNESLGDALGDLILQIDIEGAEYPVLGDLDEALLRRFRIIVIELHFIPSILTKPRFFARAAPAFERLGWFHECVHLHPNNVAGVVKIDGVDFPRVLEATFLRSDRISERRRPAGFPHPLDARHAPGRPALDLPAEWISASPDEVSELD